MLCYIISNVKKQNVVWFTGRKFSLPAGAAVQSIRSESNEHFSTFRGECDLRSSVRGETASGMQAQTVRIGTVIYLSIPRKSES